MQSVYEKAPTSVGAEWYQSVLQFAVSGNDSDQWLEIKQISCAVTKLRRLYADRRVRYSLTVVLLVAVLYKANLGRVGQAAGSVHPMYLLLALLLTGPFLYLKALRWQLMLRAAGVQAGLGESFVSLIAGMGVALLTPARLGELVRGAYLKDPHKLKIAGLVLIDKGFDVLVLVCLSVAGAWSLLGSGMGLLFAAGSVLGAVAVYRSGPFLKLALRVPLPSAFRSRLERVEGDLRAVSAASITTFLVITVCSFVVVLAQFAILLLSWRSWSLDIVILTFPLVILTNVVPITIGGLGLREAAAAALLAHYDVSPAHAVLAAFLMFALNTALPGVAGALLLPMATNRPDRVVRAADRP